LIFHSATFVASDLMAVKSVMEYSVVQIPFFICNILLLKYATAPRHLRVITMSAFVGLLLNIGLSLALMPQMGVSGIALATSIAMMVSSMLILIMLSYYEHISIMDTMIILLNWMLFLTLIVALHFQSVPSVVMTVVTYGILMFGYTKLINNEGDFFAV
jgi:putative peptidoglycan lipid II flippase